MSTVDSASPAAGETSRRHLRRIAGRRADDHRRRAIQPCRGVQSNTHLPVPQVSLQGINELLHPSCRRHDALPCRSPAASRSTQDERRAQARRIAGEQYPGGLDQEPPGRRRPITRAPHWSTPALRAPRPHAHRRRAPRDERERIRSSMATAWVAGGRCNEGGRTTGWRKASEAPDRGTSHRHKRISSARLPRFRRDRVALERRDQTAEPISLF